MLLLGELSQSVQRASFDVARRELVFRFLGRL